ncbi:hemerythrin domain-containing protein [Streptomyces sp. NPDC089799]|uniref:hemerythrin domain-containing protein n=1 Tax=Streptomyces sp. NPDC089799 TaxID=3155066 RepID=UPI003433C640
MSDGYGRPDRLGQVDRFDRFDRFDMTVMHTVHDALRRELRHIGRAGALISPDPRHLLRTTAGWGMFRTALRVHHSAADDALWPVLRGALHGRPDDLTRLVAIEAEHDAIAAIAGVVDEALAEHGTGHGTEHGTQPDTRPDTGPGTTPRTDPDTELDLFRELIGSLVTGLAGHLTHQEEAVFPLIRTALSEEQWKHFCQVHTQRIAPHAPQLLPWLLDGADGRTVAVVLAAFPERARRAYGRRWQPAYAATDRWSALAPQAAGT